MIKLETYPGIYLDSDLENVYKIKIPKAKGKEYGEIMFMGDFHYAHEAFAHNFLRKYLTLFRFLPHLQCVLMGDMFESAEFAPNYITSQKEPLDAQIEMFLQDFIPIKDRIQAILYGNHEERFMRLTHRTVDLLEYVVMKMGRKIRNPYEGKNKIDKGSGVITGVPQRGLLLVVQVGKCNYPVYVHHSSTRASVQMETQLRRTSLNWLVPLIAHGHTHKLAWLPRTFFSVSRLNDDFVRSIFRQYLLSTGCFLRYAGYAEAKSYPITDVSAPIVRFYAYKNEIEYCDPRVEYKEFLNAGVPFKPAKIPRIDFGGETEVNLFERLGFKL